jgi:repressor LexA
MVFLKNIGLDLVREPN